MQTADDLVAIMCFIDDRLKHAERVSETAPAAYAQILSDVFDDLCDIREYYPSAIEKRSESYAQVCAALVRWTDIARFLYSRSKGSNSEIEVERHLSSKLLEAAAQSFRDLEDKEVPFEVLAPETTLCEYRVTKYNPAFRDPVRGYTREDWTSIRDVGCAFGGQILTRLEYQRVENAYRDTAVEFLKESGQAGLTVWNLSNVRNWSLPFKVGSYLKRDEIHEVIGALLREEYWCQLEGTAGFIHVGWDYYMYVGCANRCANAHAFAEGRGLFVESFDSPYRTRTADNR